MLRSRVRFDEFFGRTTELAFLAQAVERSADVRSSTTLLMGPAGIGKSRLLRELERRIDGRARIAVGRCSPLLDVPYLPFEDLWRDTFGTGFRHEALAAVADAEPEVRPERIFAFAAERLQREADATPLVVAVEDVHWADAGTLALIRYLCERVADSRLCVVLTARDEAFAGDSDAFATLHALERAGARTLVLEPLKGAHVQVLVRTALAASNNRIAPDTLERVCALGAGNPLFLEELLSDAADGLHETLPASVADVVHARLATLAPDVRWTLSLAAACGERFRCAEVAAAARTPHDAVRDHVRAGCEAQLLAPTADGAYAFRHPLFREGLYRRLTPDDRIVVHERIARALEAAPKARRDIAAVAFHYRRSANAAKAVTYSRLAGDEAFAAGAYLDAAAAYRCAAADPSLAARTSARIALVAALRLAGRFADALREAETLLADAGAPLEPAARAAIVRDCCRMYSLAGDQRSAVRTLSEALAAGHVLDESDRRAIATQLAYFESLPYVGGSHAPGPGGIVAHDDDAQMLSPRELSTRAHLAGMRGDHERARRLFEAALERVDETDADVCFGVLTNYVGYLAVAGDPTSAARYGERAHAIARRYGVAWQVAHIAANLAWAYVNLGRIVDAQALLDGLDAVEGMPELIRLGIASAGVTVGALAARADLVSVSLTPSALARAAATGMPSLVGLVGASLVLHAVAHDRRADAEDVVSRTLDATNGAHGSNAFCVFAARYGLPEDAERARTSLAHVAAKPARTRQLVHSLCEAIAASRRRKPSAATRAACGRLAEDLAATGLRYFSAFALEAGGFDEEAAHAFAAMGSVLDVRRIECGTRAFRPVLTTRQAEVARLVADGCSNREIASVLGIAPGTVELHVMAIFQRLSLRSRSQLTAYVLRQDAGVATSAAAHA